MPSDWKTVQQQSLKGKGKISVIFFFSEPLKAILCNSKILIVISCVFACRHYCCIYVSMSGNGNTQASASKYSKIIVILGQTGFYLRKFFI